MTILKVLGITLLAIVWFGLMEHDLRLMAGLLLGSVGTIVAVAFLWYISDVFAVRRDQRRRGR